jgi:hypothetical protein
LEQTYQLKNDKPKAKVNLKFTAYSKNLKQNLESLFLEINRMKFITNKQMYNDTLKLFHFEIRQIQKGHLVFVTDGNGNPVRHPVKISDFEERPRFYQSKGKVEKMEPAGSYSIDKVNDKRNRSVNSRILVELIRLVPDYSDKNGSSKKKQLIKKGKRGQRKF